MNVDATATTRRRTIRTRYIVEELSVDGEPQRVKKSARSAEAVPMLQHERRVLEWLEDAVPAVAPTPFTDLPGDNPGPSLVTSHLGPPLPWRADDGMEGRLGSALAALHLARGRRPLPRSGVHALLLPQLQQAADVDAGTRRALAYLRVHWVHGAAIHGDVKWEHVRGGRPVSFIDWELGGVGDPAWDVASLLHELIMLEAAPGAVDGCLAAYRTSLGRVLSGSFALRCTAALATRFVQSRLEYTAAGAPATVVERAWAQARWWAQRPSALAVALGGAR